MTMNEQQQQQQQQQQQLGAWAKCRLSSPTPDFVNQNLHLNQIPGDLCSCHP
jgi:hypothetical protein